MANKDNKSFRQYVLLQFNKILIRNTTTNKLLKCYNSMILELIKEKNLVLEQYKRENICFCICLPLLQLNVIYKSTCPETMSPWWNHLWTIQAHLPRRPPFSQHVSWQCCNPPDILSSTAEILLFNSVFHDGVTPVSVSTLKPPLGAIGILPLKPQAFPIISVCI